MRSIFELIPESQFGEVYRQVKADVYSGQSVCVYGMLGCGVQYFLRVMELHLKAEQSIRDVLFLRGTLLRKNPENVIRKRICMLQKTPLSDFDKALERYVPEKKLCVIFDGPQYVENPDSFFTFLKDIRKTNPSSISIVIGTYHHIYGILHDVLLQVPGAISSFRRIGLYEEEVTRQILLRNNDFYKWSVPLELCGKIHELSGGNPRLTKYIGKAVDEMGPEILNDLDDLCKYPLLEVRLSEFANLLFEMDPASVAKLQIVNGNGRLFSPLFERFLLNFEIPHVDDLALGLSKKERRLFSFFYINRGRLVTKDQLEYMLGLVGDNYSLWAGYKAVERLKKKLEHRYLLRVIKGSGYVMD